MNRLYQETAQSLLDALELYMDGKITLDELREADELEKLVYGHEGWPATAQGLRNRIFSHTKQLYDEINELDRSIRTAESMNAGKEYSIGIEGLLAHAQMLGRNRAPPPGFHGSSWYVGPFPTVQMIGALRDEEADDAIDVAVEMAEENLDSSVEDG